MQIARSELRGALFGFKFSVCQSISDQKLCLFPLTTLYREQLFLNWGFGHTFQNKQKLRCLGMLTIVKG